MQQEKGLRRRVTGLAVEHLDAVDVDSAVPGHRSPFRQLTRSARWSRRGVSGTFRRPCTASVVAEEGCVCLVQGGAWRDAELITEQRARALVHPQRLGHVAARSERLHEQAVARLAERVVLEQAARGALGAGDL